MKHLDPKEKKHIYMHEIHTLYEDSGELHLCSDNGTVVFNMQTLFNDLPHIIEYCVEDQKKNKKRILQEIKELVIGQK
tara:strand:- start:112 stop:345 length:234 start_codon:yes stop_codon:yes gene_type:complete